jgi:xanthine dehydrogenase accessory factor
MLAIFEQVLARCGAGERVALCTLVRRAGSTPQLVGAIRLVLPPGVTVGTLGGGCVEAEVRTAALRQVEAGASGLMSFKLDHDLGWEDGLICGGNMDVYVEVLSRREDAERFARIVRDVAERRATEFRIVRAMGEEDYVEPMLPKDVLLIAGAGHVGQALAALAADLEFDVTVVDDRADFANSTRFPRAQRHIVGEIEGELKRYPIDAFTYVVIVTRGHRRDGAALGAVVRSTAKYIGLIGSKRKVVTILKELSQQGVDFEKLTSVHAPIGLDIGAVTVPEIAVSIAAELIAVRRNEALPAKSMRIAPELIRAAIAKPDTGAAADR